jgi:DNA topoisomerase-1
LASLIKESGEIGGNDDNQDLFRYLDGNGNDFDIKAEHINAYISKWAGSDYTAKDFRTWAASYKTAARLALISEATESELNQIIQLFDDAEKEVEGTEDQPIIKWKGINLKRADGLVKLAKNKKVPGSNKKERLNSMLAVIDTVAGDLGNTRAVCRSSYIRPMIMNDWEDKEFMKRWNSVKGKKKIPNLNKEESIVVNYMRKYE